MAIAVSLLIVAFLEGLAWASPEDPFQSAASLLSAGKRLSAIETLRSLEEEGPLSSLSGKVDFLLGILWAKEKRWKEAQIHLQRASASYPELLDYSLFFLAESQLQQGEYAAAIEALKRLLALSSRSRWKELARLRLGDAYLGAQDFSEAEKAYRGFLQDFPRSSQSNQARLCLAKVALHQGQSRTAASLLLQVELENPRSAEAKVAKSIWRKIAPPLHLDWNQRFRRALALFSAREYQRAAEEFRRLSGDPSAAEEEAGRAAFHAGMASFRARDYEGALRLLSPIGESGAGPMAEESLYWMGRSHLRLGNREEGRFSLLLLTCRFPRGPWADDAWFHLGLDEEGEGDFLQARDTYGRLIQEYPGSELWERALWRRGWASYRGGDLLSAWGDFHALYARRQGSPETSQWLYWMGRTLERMDCPAAASIWYQSMLSTGPYTYYFFRALHRLAGIEAFEPWAIQRDQEDLKPRSPLPSESPLPLPSDPACAAFLERARELAGMGLDEEALAEYGEAISLSPGDLDLVREACSHSLRMGRPDKALGWARRHLPSSWSNGGDSDLWQSVKYYYPLGYWEIVQIPEKVSAVDPYLVLAVMREESSFSADCISEAGAKGLMQLMPSTASLVAKGLGESSHLRCAGLFQPDLNIRLGAQYLADLLQEYQGNLTLALASYNAGPQAVKKWLARSPNLEDDEFIEAIPYAETHAYVKRVLRSYQIYKILYEGRPPNQVVHHVLPSPS